MYSYQRRLFRKLGRLFLRWPRRIERQTAAITTALKKNDYKRAGVEIAYLALDICAQVENQDIRPEDADKYFMYLLNIMDLPSVPLRKEVKALILEGNALHNYGKAFGADLGRMRKLANGIIGSE